ncbi:hypothetical protein JTB14_023835 [Gonioctena quinquepunctata]|nr:hypothetical protein JTB14_023835 [Gonioctena quinquepunctata]
MEDLIRKRGRSKGNITRIENFIAEHENDENLNNNELVIRENILIKAFNDYCRIQDCIEDEDESQIVEREVVEERYVAVHREKMFFITSNSDGYSLSFNAWYLGNHNGIEKITQKLILYHGNDESSTGIKLCHPFTDINDFGFMMSRTSLNKFESLVVFFQLKVTRTILSESHFLATLESCPESDQYISKPQVKISHKSMDASLVESGLNISEDHFLKRRLIFLDKTMRA